MKKIVLITLTTLFLYSCNNNKISDLECPCTLVAKQEPIYGMNEANLGEVVIEDKYGKLHTFSFQDQGVASLKNQEVGYKFGGGVEIIIKEEVVVKDTISIEKDTLIEE